MTKFYTSDTHWYHKNIIKYCNRPFKSIEEMNDGLIKNWNSVVGPDDDIYHLGDFAFIKDSEFILAGLNGRKHFIWGNHDSNTIKNSKLWASSQPYLEIVDEGQFVVLFHYGQKVFNKAHHGAIQLYGHSHGTLPGTSQSLDVGVDCWNCKPTTMKQIKERLKTLPNYKPQDRHGT